VLFRSIAYWSTRFPSLPDANQLREVTLEDPQKISAAYDEVNAWFASKHLKCLRWSPVVDAPPKTLSEFLTQRQFVQRNLVAFHLSEWKTTTAVSSVRILPARAVHDAYRATFLLASEPSTPADREQVAESFMERLDDPQLDMFVATVDKQPAGRCGLYQVGDIARVLGLFVLPDFSARGVEQALLAHVLAMARRLTMPMVLAQAARADVQRCRLLQEFGFTADGALIEFELPSPFNAVAPA